MTVSKTDSLPILSSTDIVLIRQEVRKWSGELGFSLVDQTKMITAASELARNSLDYGGGGVVLLEVVHDADRMCAEIPARKPIVTGIDNRSAIQPRRKMPAADNISPTISASAAASVK